jgi:hypothetical protein
MAMMLRRRAFTLAAAAAATAGLLIPAAAARAASGLITVTAAGSPASSVGQLSVSFDATSTVVPSSITAVLYPAGSSTAAMTVTSFTQTAGPGTGAGGTTWTVATPIPYGSGPGELPLGSYTIEVRASDQGGDSTDDTDAGTLAYLIQPSVALSVSPATYSYGQDVTFSGTDTGLYPDGSHQPVAGQVIEIDGQSYAAATTASDGSFSLALQAGVGEAGQILADQGADSDAVANATTAQVFSNLVSTTVVQDPVQISETVSPSVVTSGGTATISGTASFESGSTWLPLTNAPLEVWIPGDWGPGGEPAVWTATTDVSGNYQLSVPADVPRQYELQLTYSHYTPWMSASPVLFAIAPVAVPVTDTINARTTGSGRVVLTACVAMTNPIGGPVYLAAVAPLPALQVQYAASAAGPWKTLLTAAPDSAGCHVATANSPGRSDYYRTVTDASTAYLAGVSAGLRATPPYRSTINDFAVSPRRLRAGRRVTVTGYLNAAGPEPEEVQILFRPAGSRHWHVVRRIKLSPYSNDFSASVRLTVSGDIEARYNGAEFALACRSRTVYVRVTR